MNFTGQNYGAGNFGRIKKVLSINLASVFTVGLVFGTLVYLFGSPLLSIYISDSQSAIECGITRMQYICLTYFLCGIMDVMTGMLRGIGSSLSPMLITVLGVCGMRIGWIFTVFRMEEYHTLESLYISYPISWAITFSVELMVFLILLKRKSKKMNNKGELL